MPLLHCIALISALNLTGGTVHVELGYCPKIPVSTGSVKKTPRQAGGLPNDLGLRLLLRFLR